MEAGGGTTLMTGLTSANNELRTYLEKNEYVKSNAAENRFIMLTDVEDNSIKDAQQFIKNVEDLSIHTTIIGISDSFRS